MSTNPATVAGRVLDLPGGSARHALRAGYYSRAVTLDVGGYSETDYTAADAWLTSPETLARIAAAEKAAALAS